MTYGLTLKDLREFVEETKDLCSDKTIYVLDEKGNEYQTVDSLRVDSERDIVFDVSL